MSFSSIDKVILDLIETLWNVKVLQTRINHDVGGRFNRDIVECKAAGKDAGAETPGGFNRDIVECKVQLKMSIKIAPVDLIETLWNVKKGICPCSEHSPGI